MDTLTGGDFLSGEKKQKMEKVVTENITNDTGYNTNLESAIKSLYNNSALNHTTARAPVFCSNWVVAQHNLFQTANMFMAAAFIVPKNFKQNILLVR